MDATLTFATRQQAQEFAIAWGRHTLTGHTMTEGMTNVEVTVWGAENHKEWIEAYVGRLNNSGESHTSEEPGEKT